MITTTWGIQASVCPADLLDTALLTMEANEESRGYIRVCNIGDSSYTYKLALCDDSGAVAAKDYIAYNVEISSGDFPHEYYYDLGNSQQIRYQVDTINVLVFNVCGEKKAVT